MSDHVERLTKLRAADPAAIASALAKRGRGQLTFPRKMFLVAADHPARGVMEGSAQRSGPEALRDYRGLDDVRLREEDQILRTGGAGRP